MLFGFWTKSKDANVLCKSTQTNLKPTMDVPDGDTIGFQNCLKRFLDSLGLFWLWPPLYESATEAIGVSPISVTMRMACV